ncbi:MAG: hypothetical protein R6W68_03540 [Ignavibacteriaceae bacterium]
MSIHNKIFIGLTLFSCLIIFGCAATLAPSNWLPETEKYPENTFGGWMTIITSDETNTGKERFFQYGGEFISQDEDNVYILYDTVYIISKKDIRNISLELVQKSTTEYGLWTLGGTVATLSNGRFLIITAPLWLIAGTEAAVGESTRDLYESDNPDILFWNNVMKFARFPQGLPININLSELKAKQF